MRGAALAIGLFLVAAGCSNPLQDVPKLSEVELDSSAGQRDALPEETVESPLLVGDRAVIEQVPTVEEVEKPRGGLMGFLRGKADRAKTGNPEPVVLTTAAAPLDGDPALAETGAETVDVAALVPETKPSEPAKRKVFGFLGGAGNGEGNPRPAAGPKEGDADFEQVSLSQTLPYGRIARVCDVQNRQLGQKAGQWPERGRRYTLYDSAPGGTGQRSFYLTGFDDGCARKFSAALVLFASPESYEVIRYGPAGSNLPVSETDGAYEKVKSRVCGVRKGKPCGSKMRKLSRDTVFVTVYERFGTSPRWKTILLHDGTVEAMDLKSAS